ncbi:Uncharacterized protein BP5553_03986 [Venustampulla echinocandica]|uniref:Uncharacterized protein n=1 Tax=Venustampulla echinocandica TaxID=2656787 RepID=A0A370TVU4_9HELO|nr:Uncharacterized protein BP5553_03986 [Venustampulla echinocandica]RDL39646.1 Uncharacterized protein BP5553_03986 [Venustampulla echinocandica]
MSVSGPDIITYIGVPLAVLGVLPIIYNTISTLASLAKVRRVLRHGRLAGITRGDVVNHVIEVELPRYTIAPLHRVDQRAEYWRLCDYPSQIPGGTWTTFNWKCHTIGLKTQRIDYADQLRQPQAEIGFEELVSFLLDLGAVPDPAGFRMLRASGLWVPIGTTLLRAPNVDEPVLTVAPLDDSDGNLSLAVRWSSNWGMRDPASLPPYWVLIKGSRPPTRPTSSQSVLGKEPSKVETEETESNEAKPSKTAKYIPDDMEECLGVRCQIGTNGLMAAIPDGPENDMFEDCDIRHLEVNETLSNTTGIWFASAITALGTTSQTILWNYKIPSDILTFSKKDTIPCGVLVLLDIVPEEKTPDWASKYQNDQEADRDAQFRRMRELSRAMAHENRLSGAEKSRAIGERQMRTHEEYVDTMNAKRRRDTARAETRFIEALQSPKWDHKLVAEHLLAWLKKGNHVEEQHDLKRAVEVLLWRMVNDSVLATELGDMLDSWKVFVDNGGIRKVDYLALQEKPVMFALAGLLLAIIKDSVTAGSGSLAMDLQECVRVWKKVRLG